MKYQKKNTFDNLNNVEAEQITHLSSNQQHISINDENYPQWLVDFLINNNAYITNDRNNNLTLILPDLNQAMHVNDYFVAIKQDNDYFVIPMSQYQFETLYEAKHTPFENQFIQELTNALKEEQNNDNIHKAFHINLDPTDIFNKLSLNSLADLVNNKDVQNLLHSLGIEIETNNNSPENNNNEKPTNSIKPCTKDDFKNDFSDEWKNDMEKLLKQPIDEDINNNSHKENPFNNFSKSLADIFNDNFTNSYKKAKPKSETTDSQIVEPVVTKSNNKDTNISKPSAEAAHSDISNSEVAKVAKVAKSAEHKKPIHIPARNELSQVKDKFDNKDLAKLAMTCSSRAKLAKIIGYDSSTVSHWVRNTKHEEIKKHFN